MANIPDEKLGSIREKIFELEPYMNAALEGEMLPDHEVVLEWFDGEDNSVLLNVKTGQVLVGKVTHEWEVDEDEE